MSPLEIRELPLEVEPDALRVRRPGTEGAAANAGLAVFAAHGTEDDVVGPDLGRRARDFLRQRGHPIDWRDYPMPHSVCIEEIIAIGAWLRARMAAIEAGSP
jgi:phospholipase/carboxylesterase